jgi:hypothetical protein
MKNKVYKGEVLPGVFDGWLDVLNVPCRMSAPLLPRGLRSFKGDCYRRTDLGKKILRSRRSVDELYAWKVLDGTCGLSEDMCWQ